MTSALSPVPEPEIVDIAVEEYGRGYGVAYVLIQSTPTSLQSDHISPRPQCIGFSTPSPLGRPY